MRTPSLIRTTIALVALVVPGLLARPAVSPAAAAPSLGTLIDDANITTEVKAKLAAERLSTLTRISVSTTNGTVYLTGTAETPEERARVANIAASVKGVKEVVNNLQLASSGAASPSNRSSSGGSTSPPVASGSPSSAATTSTAAVAPAPFEATGTVAKVDRQNSTITLQDGRVIRATDQTVLWQPTTIQAIQPGVTVFVRNAQPVAFEPPTGTSAWRMGTVSRVDPTTSRIVLTDGSTLQVGSSTFLHRGKDTLTLGQVQPGSEIVARVSPSSETATTAERTGTAPSGPTTPTGVLPTSEVEIVWPPVAAR